MRCSRALGRALVVVGAAAFAGCAEPEVRVDPPPPPVDEPEPLPEKPPDKVAPPATPPPKEPRVEPKRDELALALAKARPLYAKADFRGVFAILEEALAKSPEAQAARRAALDPAGRPTTLSPAARDAIRLHALARIFLLLTDTIPRREDEAEGERVLAIPVRGREFLARLVPHRYGEKRDRDQVTLVRPDGISTTLYVEDVEIRKIPLADWNARLVSELQERASDSDLRDPVDLYRLVYFAVARGIRERSLDYLERVVDARGAEVLLRFAREDEALLAAARDDLRLVSEGRCRVPKPPVVVARKRSRPVVDKGPDGEVASADPGPGVAEHREPAPTVEEWSAQYDPFAASAPEAGAEAGTEPAPDAGDETGPGPGPVGGPDRADEQVRAVCASGEFRRATEHRKQGFEAYRVAFSGGRDADQAMATARKHFEQAVDLLSALLDRYPAAESYLEEQATELYRLLYDCVKHTKAGR